MIPRNLPYRKLSRDEIDTENLTWFDYIIGRFSGKMWWERDDIDTKDINLKHYSPIAFPEEPNNLHFLFFGKLQETEYRNNIPWLESGHQCVEGLYFYPDTLCRFDIWNLYNHPHQQVTLEIGGAVKIETLPKQENVENVLSLDDTVPPDVPLIFGPRLYAPPGEPSIPHRPFVRNNPEISNFTTIESRIQEEIQERREKKKRQQRQYAQGQRKQRQKWRKAQCQRKKRQQRQYDQHQRKQRQNDQRSHPQARRGRRVPQRVLNN